METERCRGRKRLGIEEVRDRTIKFRVNNPEYKHLKELSEKAGLEMGYFIRKEILKAKPKKQKMIPELNKEAVLLLKNIANNNNQIAKKLNSEMSIMNLNMANNHIKEIQMYLMGILNEIKNSQG